MHVVCFYLDEIDKIIHNLKENLENIEELYSKLNDIERLKVNQQIHLLRIKIDYEMTDLQNLREQLNAEENLLSINETDNQDDDNNDNLQDNSLSNELRQRHVTTTTTTTNNLDTNYDLLEDDLAYLRTAIDEVTALVAKQQEQIERLEQLRNNNNTNTNTMPTFFQKFIHNRYVPVVSGAVVGASITGPVGFLMGTKVGALVALSGSALGALSMNIMRHRATDNDETQTDETTTYNQAML